MWNKVLIAILAAVGTFYFTTLIMQGGSDSYILGRVSLAEANMRDIAAEARQRYPISYDEDGRFERRDFQFGRANDIWPDLFSGFVGVHDPFDPEEGLFLAATMDETFILISVGPNRRLDTRPEEIESALERMQEVELIETAWTYSPTNGTKSGGDIFRVDRFVVE